MAMIGRNAAVAEVGRHRHQVEGPLAFSAWLGVHAMLLSGTHSKTDAFLTWAWDYFDRDHAATIEASAAPGASPGAATTSVPHISLDRPKATAPAHQREETAMADEYDVIIIGSGAGGGTLAHRLGPSGKRVLILERGDWLPREIENWDATAVFVDNRYVSPDTWYDQNGKPFQPQIHYFVGGATKFYGAALYRLREKDFGELTHHGGTSPAWPIGYDELEPYYTQAEQLYQVHGARGEDLTDPPATAPYPYPPVSHEPRIQRLFDDLAQVGLPVPRSVRDHARRSELRRLARASGPPTCDGFPACCTPNAMPRSSRCVRRSRTKTSRSCATPPSGGWRPTPRGGRSRRRRTRRRCGAALRRVGGRGVRRRPIRQLLLASANDKHPNGLANGSDQVGRNYVFHNSRAFLAVSMEKNDTRFQKTSGMNDYYFGDDDFEYPMGNVQMVGKSSAPMYRGEKPIETRLAPTLALSEVAERGGLLALHRGPASPRQPRDPGRRRQHRRSYTPNNREPMEQLYHRVKKHLSHMGMHPHHLIPRDAYMKNDIPVAGCAHQAGTVRFGTDPATSVLDTNCKAHEVDNLYVVDTSFFPSIGR